MKVSLKTKTFVMIFILTTVLCVASIIGTNIALTNIIRQQFIDKAESVTNVMANLMDKAAAASVRDKVMRIYNATDEKDKVSNEEWGSPEHEAYVNRYSTILEMPEFISLQKWMRTVQDEGNFAYIYLVAMDTEKGRTIYVADASYDDEMCMPGSYDPFTENDYKLIDNPSEVPLDIVETEEYGWTMALGKPVRDMNGDIIAYFCADSSMTEITKIKNHYLLIIAAVLVGLALLTGILGVLAVNHFVVKPVKILSAASIEYCREDDKDQHHKFKELNIRAKDEIGDLASSMVQMENDINDHVATLIKTANELIESREKEAELRKAANIDALTHVKNKRALFSEEERLDRAIREGKANFAVAMIDMNNLKTINDTYGHEKGDEAIMDLCNAICSTFKRSPVFRTGGDEFVVVLEGHDLEQKDELIVRFRETAAQEEAKKPWRNMSAALGCQVYDRQRHNHFADVYKEADADMYRNKAAMKAGRK
jgi:diguanylate cyclase (GGDEF)-like protein